MLLVLATENSQKAREFRQLLVDCKGLDVVTLAHFPQYSPLPEEGSSFEEIALAKALHAAHVLQQWVLADDSGLVVPALEGGGPAIFSRRYAGPEATDAENRHKLLKEMAHLEDERRYAYFACALAVAGPGGEKKSVVGRCEGMILTQERGRNGFGYDALFVKHGYDKSFAELDPQLKNRISHRYKAVEKIKPYLIGLCGLPH